MTKKLSLEAAKKLATPGPVRYSPHFRKNAEGHLFFASAGGACTIHLEGAASATQAWLDRHAALLAHRWNTHDELVEALEDLAFDAGRVERKFSEGRDWAEWRDLRDKLNALKPLLARAKTVEIF